MLLTISIIVLVGLFLNELAKKYSLKNLKYRQNFSKTIVEIGEEFYVESIVENNKILPVTFLQINEEYPNIIEYINKASITKKAEAVIHTITMIILPFQRVKRKYMIMANKRGRYLCKNASLVIGDILGLKVFNETFSFLHEIVVLPKKAILKEEIVPYGDYNGDVSVKRWIIEDPILTVGIREYTGYEPQKTIHWPSSLKSGRIMVKKFDYTTDNRAMLILNVETHKPFWLNIEGENIEKCISIARAAVEELEESGIPYGFMSNGQIMGEFRDEVIMPGWGTAHYNNILEGLGRLDHSITHQFEDMAEGLITNNVRYGTYIMITAYVLNEYIEYINILSNQCERFIIIALDSNNLDLLNDKIVKYVKRGEKS